MTRRPGSTRPGADSRPVRRAAASPAAVLLVLAAGCAGDQVDAGRDRAAAGSDDGCAPRQLEHRYGTAEVRADPERVVPLTFRDQDAVLALGEIPLAVQDGYYATPYVQWPWVREHLEGAEPRVLPVGELNFEQVAALRPDVILGTASGMTGEEHAILDRIAPTVAQLAGYVDYGVPWQETLRVVGRALCREAEAERRVAELEAALAEARVRSPAFDGATAVVAMAGGPGGSFWAFGPQDSRGRFLGLLGLEQPPAIGRLAGGRFVATLSGERLDLLDADVLIWVASAEQRAELEADPIYRRLDVVREERVLYLEPTGLLTAAITNTTALNLPYLLEELAPRIAGALQRRDPVGAEG